MPFSLFRRGPTTTAAKTVTAKGDEKENLLLIKDPRSSGNEERQSRKSSSHSSKETKHSSSDHSSKRRSKSTTSSRRRLDDSSGSRSRRSKSTSAAAATGRSERSSRHQSTRTSSGGAARASTTTSKRHSKSKSRSSKRTSLRVSAEDFMIHTNEVFSEKYKLGEVLYEGKYCRIHECLHKLTGTSRVVKVVMEQDNHHSLEPDMTERTIDYNSGHLSNSSGRSSIGACPEFDIMRTLDTSFVPKVYKLYEQDSHHMIVMERCYGNNLEMEMNVMGSSLEESVVKQVMWQIISCLNYLHDTANVVHCDLRPINILLDQPHDFSKVKIIDFDEAVRLSQQDGKIRERRGLGKGADVVYQAPEAHGNHPKFDNKADLWSCGILMYHMLYRKHPFVSEHSIRGRSTKDTAMDVLRRMKRSKLKFPKKEVSEDAKDLIAMLLHPNPKKRPSAAQVLQNAWFQPKKRASRRLSDPPLEDPLQALERMQRLSCLRKHNPNSSRLKQAVCAVIGAELLTKEEHAKVDAVFQKLDILKDGKLRPHEVRAGFLLSTGVHLTDDELDSIFERCDSNRNGSLDYSEFAIASMDERELLSKDRLKRAFQRFDRHKRGKIGLAELRVIPAFVRYSDDDLNGLIAEVDKQNKGYIQFNAFVQAMSVGRLY